MSEQTQKSKPKLIDTEYRWGCQKGRGRGGGWMGEGGQEVQISRYKINEVMGM